jgi:hypothetical protein
MRIRGRELSHASRRARHLTPALVLGGTVTIALSACPTVDLGEAPVVPGTCHPDPAYYREVIWPEVLAPADANRSCVSASGCHGRQDGRSALRLITGTALSETEHSANYDVVTRFLNCGAPDASPLLTKPLAGIDPHGGKDLFDAQSAPAKAILDWLAR